MLRNGFYLIVLASFLANYSTGNKTTSDFILTLQQKAVISSSRKRDLSRHYPYQRHGLSELDKSINLNAYYENEREERLPASYTRNKLDRSRQRNDYGQNSGYKKEPIAHKSSTEKSNRNGVSVSFGSNGPVSIHLSKQNGGPRSDSVQLHVNVNKEREKVNSDNIKVSYAPQGSGSTSNDSFELEIDKQEPASGRSVIDDGSTYNGPYQDYSGRSRKVDHKNFDYNTPGRDYASEDTDLTGNPNVNWKHRYPGINKEVSFVEAMEEPEYNFRSMQQNPFMKMNAGRRDGGSKWEIYTQYSGQKRNADGVSKGSDGLFGGEDIEDGIALKQEEWNVPLSPDEYSRGLGVEYDVKEPHPIDYAGSSEMRHYLREGMVPINGRNEQGASSHSNEATVRQQERHAPKTLTDEDIKQEIRKLFHSTYR